MYVADPGILSVYASGRGTAISLNIGDGVAHTTTVFEGTDKIVLLFFFQLITYLRSFYPECRKSSRFCWTRSDRLFC